MNPDDPRARRTRAGLRTALLSLLADTPPERITVSAVAREAGINRATVYQHYADIDALVADAMEGALAHAARCAALCPLEAPTDGAPAPLVDLFAHVIEHGSLYRTLLAGDFAHRLRASVARELEERFATGARPPGTDGVPDRALSSHLAGGLVALLTSRVGQEGPGPGAEESAAVAWRLLAPVRHR
ncbi:TetR/AcrR family transcriptional regulator [Nocardiopsis sp. N85]|uniref:TetR/AcrR family transcriptional regulator n=1 Tax=Nocardiopsis sp. N85 TaxID=3029400 RepID=UPI00237FD197|nr:TetR/AcrR family transcriptional regulator [Nocardiopsis sp. N85]MDE3720577.1 TetR/AcrR family transcriptional regulator [Nocardiopsis sp. N85]